MVSKLVNRLHETKKKHVLKKITKLFHSFVQTLSRYVTPSWMASQQRGGKVTNSHTFPFEFFCDFAGKIPTLQKFVRKCV